MGAERHRAECQGEQESHAEMVTVNHTPAPNPGNKPKLIVTVLVLPPRKSPADQRYTADIWQKGRPDVRAGLAGSSCSLLCPQVEGTRSLHGASAELWVDLEVY